ncbi:protein-L-isoaspartate O-methyltransferase family protein [Magnetofaba australis]|uniref:Protein-L-isoaspartate O-methyltransferase n=1 Tax=Magnetofaba australis IT-1 TaxID=1434232 RepID=A0A1Y2K620_9PROT|nr:protein-L-isoaspartate O-methyltransferase [Magnetofaba australis]OSM04970.1 putative protein-L-isoaspartate(D-aspartate) O-methyltransferase [Magnetofaba australis IT-1]
MDTAQARANMVKSQVLPNNVQNEALLAAMNSVARENFAPEKFAAAAYSDMAIPLDDQGRRMLSPLQAAWLIQSLDIQPGAKALVVGAGLGYEAALLATMGAKVYAVESDAALAELGKAATAGLDVQWRVGELAEGWKDPAPYDAILFCGAADKTPSQPVGQLTDDGRLSIIHGVAGEPVMAGVKIVGFGGADHAETLFETVATPLPGLAGGSGFTL